ncbi:hypothetical protein [Pseudodesulfovibrio sp. zrk46]|uniref:hypothetical protein n=1 Tax=Pseudodesulfovibrio sp. zrk46 TaxID=2725288 RepID=UPI001449DBC1|nr:hypothetical protein [Pseudodesulfovibrio sp. zrk46]QJB57469.1 hypothetical protein HFN16_14100 [Pseudodesulfovibrio sp. zrk46]
MDRDYILDLMGVRSALVVVADTLEERGQNDVTWLIYKLAQVVDEAAEEMDNNNWGPGNWNPLEG